MNYPINEMFQTIQGEGYYTGTPAIFIRLQGCPIHCSWCDTKYTWKCSNENQISYEELKNKTISKHTWSNINITQILDNIKKKNWTAKHVVITGGEPCIYNLLYLTKELEQKGFYCQIETSGAKLIKCSSNSWVTVSPKKHQKTLYTSILRSNEIKYPILKEEDLCYLETILAIVPNKKHQVFLQPISQNKEALRVCIKHCTIKNWRISIQLHKYLLIK